MAKEKQTSEKNAAKKSTPKKSSAKQAVAKKPVVENGTKPVSAAKPSQSKAKPSQEALFREISIRAYELFIARGAKHGAHEEDWKRAEAEVKTKYNL